MLIWKIAQKINKKIFVQKSFNQIKKITKLSPQITVSKGFGKKTYTKKASPNGSNNPVQNEHSTVKFIFIFCYLPSYPNLVNPFLIYIRNHFHFYSNQVIPFLFYFYFLFLFCLFCFCISLTYFSFYIFFVTLHFTFCFHFYQL